MRQFLYVLSLAAALLPVIGTAATVSAPEKPRWSYRAAVPAGLRISGPSKPWKN